MKLMKLMKLRLALDPTSKIKDLANATYHVNMVMPGWGWGRELCGLCVFLCVCVNVCVCMFYTWICVFKYVCVCVYECVCMLACVHMCAHQSEAFLRFTVPLPCFFTWTRIQFPCKQPKSAQAVGFCVCSGRDCCCCSSAHGAPWNAATLWGEGGAWSKSLRGGDRLKLEQ